MTTRSRWSATEDEQLLAAIETCGLPSLAEENDSRWQLIASYVPGRTNKQVRKRWLHSLNPSLKKSGWTPEEDQALISLFGTYGPRWAVIAQHIPGRTDDACSKRYREALDPNLRTSPWEPHEDEQLIRLQAEIGPQWSRIGGQLNRGSLNCRNRYRLLQRRGRAMHPYPNVPTVPSTGPASPPEATNWDQPLPAAHVTTAPPSHTALLRERPFDPSDSAPSPLPFYPTPLGSQTDPISLRPLPPDDFGYLSESDTVFCSSIPRAPYFQQGLSPNDFSPASTSQTSISDSPQSLFFPPLPATAASFDQGSLWSSAFPAIHQIHSPGSQPHSPDFPFDPMLSWNPLPLSLDPLSIWSPSETVSSLSPQQGPTDPLDDSPYSMPPTVSPQSLPMTMDVLTELSPAVVVSSLEPEAQKPNRPHAGTWPTLLLTPPEPETALEPSPVLALRSDISSEFSELLKAPTTPGPTESILFSPSISASRPTSPSSPRDIPKDLPRKATSHKSNNPRFLPRLSQKLSVCDDPSVLAYACAYDACWSAEPNRIAFATGHELSGHIKNHHSSHPKIERRYRCGLSNCNKTFKNINGLQYHLQVSTDHFRNAISNRFSKSVPEVDKATGAMPTNETNTTEHNPVRLHECPYRDCFQVYRSSSGLRYHIKKVHSSTQPAQLDDVPKAWTSDLTAHMKKLKMKRPMPPSSMPSSPDVPPSELT